MTHVQHHSLNVSLIMHAGRFNKPTTLERGKYCASVKFAVLPLSPVCVCREHIPVEGVMRVSIQFLSEGATPSLMATTQQSKLRPGGSVRDHEVVESSGVVYSTLSIPSREGSRVTIYLTMGGAPGASVEAVQENW